MEIIAAIKDWIIPIGSILLSGWFALSAKRESDRAQWLLSRIDDAIQGWQAQIMESTKSILDTTPQVIEGKARLATIEAAKMVIESMHQAIHASVSDPRPGASGHTQTENLKELGSQLTKILDTMRQK